MTARGVFPGQFGRRGRAAVLFAAAVVPPMVYFMVVAPLSLGGPFTGDAALFTLPEPWLVPIVGAEIVLLSAFVVLLCAPSAITHAVVLWNTRNGDVRALIRLRLAETRGLLSVWKAAAGAFVVVGGIFVPLLVDVSLSVPRPRPPIVIAVRSGVVSVSTLIALAILMRNWRREIAFLVGVHLTAGRVCRSCGYDMTGFDEGDACPECGVEYRELDWSALERFGIRPPGGTADTGSAASPRDAMAARAGAAGLCVPSRHDD